MFLFHISYVNLFELKRLLINLYSYIFIIFMVQFILYVYLF